MATLRNVVVKLIADAQEFSTGVKKSKAEIRSLEKEVAAVGRTVAGVFAVGIIGKKFLDETKQAQYAMAQLEATVKSTGGAAGLTVTELDDLSNALQRTSTFSDETVKGAQAVLLTFTSIRGDVFRDATQAAADMATLLGGDLKSSALQVGKALQDPVEGINALRRAGVSFDEEQRKVIKHLVETGQKAEAQRLILAELKKEFGGSAAAARDTLGGALEHLKNQWGELFEVSGTSSQGIVDGLNAVADALPAVGQAFSSVLQWVLTLGARAPVVLKELKIAFREQFTFYSEDARQRDMRELAQLKAAAEEVVHDIFAPKVKTGSKKGAGLLGGSADAEKALAAYNKQLSDAVQTIEEEIRYTETRNKGITDAIALETKLLGLKKLSLEQLKAEAALRNTLGGPLPLAGGIVGSENTKLRGGLMDMPGIAKYEPEIKAATTAAKSLFGGIRDQLKSQLDPKLILSNLASGGISAALGLATKGFAALIDKLGIFRSASAEVADAMKRAAEAQHAAAQAQSDYNAAIRTAFGQSQSAAQQQEDEFRNLLKKLLSVGGNGATNAEQGLMGAGMTQIREYVAALLSGTDPLTDFQKQLIDLLKLFDEGADRLKEDARKAAEAEAKRRAAESASFESMLRTREAALGGSDIEAIKARMAASAAEELARAKDLLESGTITQDLFDRLAKVLDGELNKALEDAAAKAKEAAEAIESAKRSFEDNLTLEELDAQGKTTDAALKRAELHAADLIAQAKKLFTGDELQKYIDRINKDLAEQIARINNGGGASDATAAAMSAGRSISSDVAQSLTSLSESSGLRLIDIERTSMGLLAQIEMNTRGGGAASPLGDNNQLITRRGGNTVIVNFNGSVNDLDYRQIALRINTELAQMAESDSRLFGN